jgi:hypothetical protein
LDLLDLDFKVLKGFKEHKGYKVELDLLDLDFKVLKGFKDFKALKDLRGLKAYKVPRGTKVSKGFRGIKGSKELKEPRDLPVLPPMNFIMEPQLLDLPLPLSLAHLI